MAKLYYLKKMNDKSIKLWKKITELVPEDKTAFYELYQIHKQKLQITNAIITEGIKAFLFAKKEKP